MSNHILLPELGTGSISRRALGGVKKWLVPTNILGEKISLRNSIYKHKGMDYCSCLGEKAKFLSYRNSFEYHS